MPRYLTKSRYKLGLECPTKLFYTGKKVNYPSTKMDDPFLEALAEGGYQVGELAKNYFPGGHDIEVLNHEEAEKQTKELLKQEDVIIYEAAIKYENLFIRIDVLVKNGNKFDLIEVKSKSFDSSDKNAFFGKRGNLSSKWSTYLHDVAFQRYVLNKAYPEASICCYMMLADKNKMCATNGLNQKFRITRDGSRKGVKVSSTLSNADLEHRMLIQVPVDNEVKYIHEMVSDDGRTFPDTIDYLSQWYKDDVKIPPNIGSKCKKCEFTCLTDQEKQGGKSGYKECWKQVLNWQDEDFDEPNVQNIWNFKGSDKLIDQRKVKFSDLSKEDLKVKGDGEPGLSGSQRQWLQVDMSKGGVIAPHLDVEGMKSEMQKWTFPLHFIDFETTTVALPFTVGRKPYETIVFQFSHHIYHEDGRIEHADEYINTERGVFPNVDFIRALKDSLERDQGTIFRYHNHENTCLNTILKQLQAMEDAVDDLDELCTFIKTITHSTGSVSESWKGDRDIVDMHWLVRRYYYNPATKGSNSIKDVLPAVLNSSKYLQDKYSQPIYGVRDGIRSCNYMDWVWVEMDEDGVIDPYKKLPKLFQDVSDKEFSLLSDDDELAHGGAAMTAYAKIQFQEMSDYERRELSDGLKKYCELDTFAMVMIYEAWRDML